MNLAKISIGVLIFMVFGLIGITLGVLFGITSPII